MPNGFWEGLTRLHVAEMDQASVLEPAATVPGDCDDLNHAETLEEVRRCISDLIGPRIETRVAEPEAPSPRIPANYDPAEQRERELRHAIALILDDRFAGSSQ